MILKKNCLHKPDHRFVFVFFFFCYFTGFIFYFVVSTCGGVEFIPSRRRRRRDLMRARPASATLVVTVSRARELGPERISADRIIFLCFSSSLSLFTAVLLARAEHNNY